jgi:hypothetical protein
VCSANSNCITINVNSVTPGAISGSQTICSEGDPDAFTAGTGASGSGTLSYQWQSSTTNCTSGFTNILGATSPTYDPPAGLTVKTYYRRIVISTLNNIQCTATSNCVTVDVNTIMTIATCSKTDATCNGTSTGSVSAGALTGAVGSPTYSWKNAADQVVGNAASVNNLPAGVYTLTVKDNCTTRDCQVTIVEPPLLSASILGSTTVCQGDPSPKVTFTNPQAFPVTITYNINGGANLTVSVGTNTTATVDVLTTNPGTFTYNLVSVTQQGAPSCSNTVSGTPATVIVNPKPAPVIIYHN